MYARQVGNQVALVMDEEQAEELYILFEAIRTMSTVGAEIYEALRPVMGE